MIGVEAKILRHAEALRGGSPEDAAAAIAALGRIGEDDVAGSLSWPDVLAGLGSRLAGEQASSPARAAALEFLRRLFSYFEALPSSVQMAQVFTELSRRLAALPAGDAPGCREAAIALAEMGAALPRRWQGLPEALLGEAAAARVAVIAAPCAVVVDEIDPLASWCGTTTASAALSLPSKTSLRVIMHRLVTLLVPHRRH